MLVLDEQQDVSSTSTGITAGDTPNIPKDQSSPLKPDDWQFEVELRTSYLRPISTGHTGSGKIQGGNDPLCTNQIIPRPK